MPFVTAQVYVAPGPASGTDARTFVALAQTVLSVVIAADGSAEMVLVAAFPAEHPFPACTDSDTVTWPLSPATYVSWGVPAPETMVPPFAVHA